MSDPDQRVTFSLRADDSLPDAIWTSDEITNDEEFPTVGRAEAFTSLGFIGAALKRSMWLLFAIALAGMLIGYGLHAKFPPAYQATTSLLLKNSEDGDPGQQILTNVTLAQSRAVAGSVVRRLGLHQSVSSFISSYTVAFPSDEVLVITVGASSSGEAVRRAAALDTAFLQFRAQMLRAQQRLEETSLNQQIDKARQHLNSLNSEISSVSAKPTTPAQQSKLGSLRAQATYAGDTLTATFQNASEALATTQQNLSAMIGRSQVLNASTAIPLSKKRSLVFYVAVGFVGGAVVGIGIVVVMALVSDRLRRRSDIADAIGAPVGLSVGPASVRGWLPVLSGLRSRRAVNMGHVVAHLRDAVQGSSRRPAGLVIVAVDKAQVAAQAVVELAASYASQGRKVVVADLSDGAHAARLLRIKGSGIHAIRQDGVEFLLTVPDRDDVAPTGPLQPGTSAVGPDRANEELIAACSSADVLLTVATLDPAFGADYLVTWADRAVAVVTAGCSTEVRVHAAGEMIRLAGMRLVSVMLIGADKSDESLGATRTADQLVPARSAWDSSWRDTAILPPPVRA